MTVQQHLEEPRERSRSRDPVLVSVYDLHGALRQACRFGGWTSARPICIFGRVPLAYLGVTDDAVRLADEDADSYAFHTKPSRHAASHLKSTCGGTVSENAA